MFQRVAYIYYADLELAKIRTKATNFTTTVENLNKEVIQPTVKDVDRLRNSTESFKKLINSTLDNITLLKKDLASLDNAKNSFVEKAVDRLRTILPEIVILLIDNVLVTNPVQEFGRCKSLAVGLTYVKDVICKSSLQVVSGIWFLCLFLGIFLIFAVILNIRLKKRVEFMYQSRQGKKYRDDDDDEEKGGRSKSLDKYPMDTKQGSSRFNVSLAQRQIDPLEEEDEDTHVEEMDYRRRPTNGHREKESIYDLLDSKHLLEESDGKVKGSETIDQESKRLTVPKRSRAPSVERGLVLVPPAQRTNSNLTVSEKFNNGSTHLSLFPEKESSSHRVQLNSAPEECSTMPGQFGFQEKESTPMPDQCEHISSLIEHQKEISDQSSTKEGEDIAPENRNLPTYDSSTCSEMNKSIGDMSTKSNNKDSEAPKSKNKSGVAGIVISEIQNCGSISTEHEHHNEESTSSKQLSHRHFKDSRKNLNLRKSEPVLPCSSSKKMVPSKVMLASSLTIDDNDSLMSKKEIGREDETALEVQTKFDDGSLEIF
jgi:hypothetical protein